MDALAEQAIATVHRQYPECGETASKPSNVAVEADWVMTPDRGEEGPSESPHPDLLRGLHPRSFQKLIQRLP